MIRSKKLPEKVLKLINSKNIDDIKLGMELAKNYFRPNYYRKFASKVFWETPHIWTNVAEHKVREIEYWEIT